MKINLKGLKQEMSTTGTGASFAAGTGEQYATPKAFKKRKDEVGEPFSTPSPSIPNRKSKVIDYKKLFQEAVDELSEAEVGDTKTTKGIKSTVSDVDPVTGQISWDIEYVPAFDSVYKEFDDLRKVISQLDQKTDDAIVDDIAAKIRSEFNRYRTHIRKNYPEAYKKFTLNEARYTEFKKKSQFRTPTQQLHMAVREIRRKIDEMTKVVAFTERMRTELKASNEGMSYLNRTRESISKINEKLQELNNRIKGLTE